MYILNSIVSIDLYIKYIIYICIYLISNLKRTSVILFLAGQRKRFTHKNNANSNPAPLPK